MLFHWKSKPWWELECLEGLCWRENEAVYYNASEDLEKRVESMDKLSYVEMAGILIPIKSIKANSGNRTEKNPECAVENRDSV